MHLDPSNIPKLLKIWCEKLQRVDDGRRCFHSSVFSNRGSLCLSDFSSLVF